MNTSPKNVAGRSPDELEELSAWYENHDTLTGTEADYDDEIEVEVAPQKTQVRSVRLPVSTVRRLNEAAATRGLGPTELMRLWIEERLNAEHETTSARIAVAQSTIAEIVKVLGVSLDKVLPAFPDATVSKRPGEGRTVRSARSDLGPAGARGRSNSRRTRSAVTATYAPGVGAPSSNSSRTTGEGARSSTRAKRTSLKVQPREEGGWIVTGPGKYKAAYRADTQADAIAHARELIQMVGGGQLEIYRRDGNLRASDTVAPASKRSGPRPGS